MSERRHYCWSLRVRSLVVDMVRYTNLVFCSVLVLKVAIAMLLELFAVSAVRPWLMLAAPSGMIVA